MAKVKSNLFDLSGKLGELVFVNNKVYGAYVRLPRGSRKPAALNEALQRNADKAKPVTHLAKIIYRALSESCGSFRQRDLWQRMLKRMYPVASADTPGLVKSLAGLEMHSRYPFSRLQPGLRTNISIDTDVLRLALHPQSHPVFQAELQAECYRYDVHLFWLTANCEAIITSEGTSGWIACTDVCLPSPFSFPLPHGTGFYLVLLQLRGGRDNQAIDTMPSTGMQIIAAGDVISCAAGTGLPTK